MEESRIYIASLGINLCTNITDNEQTGIHSEIVTLDEVLEDTCNKKSTDGPSAPEQQEELPSAPDIIEEPQSSFSVSDVLNSTEFGDETGSSNRSTSLEVSSRTSDSMGRVKQSRIVPKKQNPGRKRKKKKKK